MTRHRMKSFAPREDLAGLCFPTATREAADRGGEVVHALVTHPVSRMRYWHAWVERDGRVYDNTVAQLPIAKFYELFQPKDVRRYSHYEANTCMLRTRHHGPWESGEMGDKPSPPRKKIRRSR